MLKRRVISLLLIAAMCFSLAIGVYATDSDQLSVVGTAGETTLTVTGSGMSDGSGTGTVYLKSSDDAEDGITYNKATPMCNFQYTISGGSLTIKVAGVETTKVPATDTFTHEELANGDKYRVELRNAGGTIVAYKDIVVGGVAAPEFAEYEVTMADEQATSVDLTLTNTQAEGTYKVYSSEEKAEAAGVSVTPDLANDKLSLTFTTAPTEDGEYYFTVTVNDVESGVSEKVTVKAAPAAPKLTGLTVTDGSLTTAFDPKAVSQDYTARVDTDKESMKITPAAPEGADVTVKIEGQDAPLTKGADGSYVIPASAVGKKVTIEVSDPDTGAKSTYTLTIQDNSVTIKFVSEKGEFAANALKDRKRNADAAVGNLPAPTSETYVDSDGASWAFGGWFDGETEYTAESTVSEDVTLTAKWTQTTFKASGSVVKGESNASTLVGIKVELYKGENKVDGTFTTTDNGAIDFGYLENGDYKAKVGASETEYKASETSFTIKDADKTDIQLTLTALDELMVTFDAGEGSGTMEPVHVKYNETYTLPESSFTAPDATKVFDKWQIGSETYEIGADVVVIDDLTVIALWKDAVSEGYPTLKSLTISNVTLTPAFNPKAVNYDGGSVANSVSSVTVTPTLADDSADATITVNGKVVTSGSGSTVSLSTGENAIEVAVTSGDKTTTYRVTVTRKSSSGGGSISGGGGGGGGSSASTVTKTSTTNGSYSLSSTTATAGDIVKISPKANAGYEVDAVTVTDKNGNAVAVTKNADGTYSFTMPAANLQPVKTTVTFKQSTATPTPTPSTGFSDVADGAYYADAVKWAVEQGITKGTGATTFSPEASCTRAEVVTFLWRAAGSPEPAGSAAFSDVQSGSYYEKAVAWAVENGITNGTGDNQFSPDATVTRAQVVTFLYRYEKASAGTNNPFTDVADDAYYAAAVSWAVENGITNGTSATTFSPDDDCTRGQIVTFLYRDMAE